MCQEEVKNEKNEEKNNIDNKDEEIKENKMI